MPSLLDCILMIEDRCRTKGNVVTMPKEILLALKVYGRLLKDLCEIGEDYLGTTLFCMDDDDKFMINDIAKEDWS